MIKPCKIISLIVLISLVAFVFAPVRGACEKLDLNDLSLEELTSMGLSNTPKAVTARTAAKITQTTAASPSVVRIITAEDIKIFGYRTLDDILRSLPGLYTTSDGLNTYLGVRGLGRPGDYNTRILILIDGVRVNDNIFDSALVGREFPLDIDLIERIEYAPGPGSAVYGKNAFFGVINVLTKHGNGYDGVELSGGAGSAHTKKIRFSYGNRFKNNAELLLSLSGFKNSDAGPDLFDGFHTNDNDFEENRTFFGKFSYGAFQAEILYGKRKNGTQVFPYTGLINEYDSIQDKRFYVDTRYSTHLGQNWAVEISGTYNEALYRGVFPYLYDNQRIDDVENYPGSWLAGEFSAVSSHFQNHRLLFGVEGHKDLELKAEGYEQGGDPFFYMADRYSSYGIYVQDEITLSDTVILLLGGRYDNTEFGSKINPRVGLIWQPREETTLKVLYGSAFRTANFFEASTNLDVINYTGIYNVEVPSLETIKTLEIALEHYLTPSTRLSGSVYHYRLEDIIEEDYDENTGIFSFQNGRAINAIGFEFTAEKRFSNGALLDLSYAWQRTRDADGHRLSNSPGHLLKARSSIPLWFENGRVGAEVQYVSDRKTQTGLTIDAFWLANVTATYQITRSVNLSASVYNIGNTRYTDPTRSILFMAEGMVQEGRSFYFQVDVKF